MRKIPIARATTIKTGRGSRVFKFSLYAWLLLPALHMIAGCFAASADEDRDRSLVLPKRPVRIPLGQLSVESSGETSELQKFHSRLGERRSNVGKSLPNEGICPLALRELRQDYRGLVASLDTEGRQWVAARIPILQDATKVCGDERLRRIVLSGDASLMFQNFASKVAVLVSKDDPMATAIRDGVLRACRVSGRDCDNMLIFRDLPNDEASASRQISEVILQDRAAIIIASGPKAHMERVARISKLFQVTTLLMTADPSLLANNKQVFQVFPQETAIAAQLRQTLQKRGAKSIAILRPNDGSADALIQSLSEEMGQFGIQVQSKVGYSRGDFASISNALQQLLVLDPSKRPEDWAATIQEAREQALERKVRFDPTKIVLPPKIDFDALFVPDDFVFVRHLAKLLRFHGVDKLTLFGDQRWRESGLVDPPEPFLNGAFFADFIGSYRQVGELMGVKMDVDFFLPPELSGTVDFQIIAFRATQLALAALEKTSVRSVRRELRDILMKLDSPGGTYFRSFSAFNDRRQAVWPAFVFQARDNGIVLE